MQLVEDCPDCSSGSALLGYLSRGTSRSKHDVPVWTHVMVCLLRCLSLYTGPGLIRCLLVNVLEVRVKMLFVIVLFCEAKHIQ